LDRFPVRFDIHSRHDLSSLTKGRGKIAAGMLILAVQRKRNFLSTFQKACEAAT
jgi:hypothetical protein